MMRKIVLFTVVALGLFGGVALADRDHHRGRDRHDRHVRDHRGYDRHDYRRDYDRRDYYRRHDGRRYVSHRGAYDYGYRRVVRKPIYVSRPVIHQRYYNYYRRPAVIVENYNPMAGYYWVPGSWSWNGYEWVWQPGHYQPDPSYLDPAYGY